MASTAESANEAAPEAPEPDVLSASESRTSVRSFYRLENGSLVSCEPNAAQIKLPAREAGTPREEHCTETHERNTLRDP